MRPSKGDATAEIINTRLLIKLAESGGISNFLMKNTLEKTNQIIFMFYKEIL
jgi:hypothetical protein